MLTGRSMPVAFFALVQVARGVFLLHLRKNENKFYTILYKILLLYLYHIKYIDIYFLNNYYRNETIVFLVVGKN